MFVWILVLFYILFQNMFSIAQISKFIIILIIPKITIYSIIVFHPKLPHFFNNIYKNIIMSFLKYPNPNFMDSFKSPRPPSSQISIYFIHLTIAWIWVLLFVQILITHLGSGTASSAVEALGFGIEPDVIPNLFHRQPLFRIIA